MDSYLTMAKWIGIGVLALLVFGAIGFGIYTVDSWHRDSQALVGVTAARDDAIKQRDDAKKAKADEETKFVGTLGNIGQKIITLQGNMNALQAQLDRDRADRTNALNNFLEATANVSPTAAPGSPDDLLVRSRLLDFLRNPDTGQLGRGDGGDGKAGNGAGVPGAVAQPGPVPGQPAGNDPKIGKAVVPSAGAGGRQGAKRTAERCRRRRADLGAGRTGGPAAVGHVRQAVPGKGEIIVCGSRRCGKSIRQALIEFGLRTAGIVVVHG
jgi:hypothetical protein